MDFLYEGIALGVDLLILGICFKEYYNCRKTVHSLEAAPQLQIDDNLKNILSKQKDKKLPYAVIRGRVTPIGPPFQSVMSPSVTAVLQVIKLSEHCVTREYGGFWTEERRVIHVSSNEMPFQIKNGNSAVDIVNALSAKILDLDLVYNNYEPSSLSLVDHIFGFFSGMRQKGIQTTEEVLRDGSFITAVGELELVGKTIKMQPTAAAPLFLTTSTKSTLIQKFEEAKSSMGMKILVCSTVTVIIVGIILRKIYLKKKKERNDRLIRETLDNDRKQRRSRIRQQNLSPEQACVVCATNPKEVIILPCGHVCLCEDCSEKIQDSCPVCRTKIDMKAAAFIA